MSRVTVIAHALWWLRYGLDDRGLRSVYSARTRIFLFSRNTYTVSEAYLSSYTASILGAFSGLKTEEGLN